MWDWRLRFSLDDCLSHTHAAVRAFQLRTGGTAVPSERLYPAATHTEPTPSSKHNKGFLGDLRGTFSMRKSWGDPLRLGLHRSEGKSPGGCSIRIRPIRFFDT